MRAEVVTELITRRAPDSAQTPWLSGRGPKRQLVQDFAVKLDGRMIRVPAGYIFNGSSIPWFLWWLFPPGYTPAWRAAAVHDFIYSHLYRRLSKRFADDAFRALMLKDGASPWIAKTFHAAVRTFGRGGW